MRQPCNAFLRRNRYAPRVEGNEGFPDGADPALQRSGHGQRYRRRVRQCTVPSRHARLHRWRTHDPERCPWRLGEHDPGDRRFALANLPGHRLDIRALNAALPLGKRFRVLLGDPPIDWNSAHDGGVIAVVNAQLKATLLHEGSAGGRCEQKGIPLVVYARASPRAGSTQSRLAFSTSSARGRFTSDTVAPP